MLVSRQMCTLKKTIKNLYIFLLLLTGCNFEPRYVEPILETPTTWKHQTEPVAIETIHRLENWWEIFDDNELNALEEVAVSDNKRLLAALEKVFAARALVGIRGADLYPQVTLKPAYNSIGALIQVFGIPPPLPTIIRVHEMLYSLPLNLSYEIDLWGKIRNQYDSAYRNLEAECGAWRNVLLTLTTDLAINYFQLRSLDLEIQYLEKTIKVRKDNAVINRERYEAGFIIYSDVSRAETLLANAEALYERTLRLRTLKENMIATLCGKPASAFSIAFRPLDIQPPPIPPALPSRVLLNRPDLNAAERKAASEHALIGASYASFFPTLSLTGGLGFSSPNLKEFLKWKSRYWNIGANSEEPVFDGWRTCSGVDFSWARFRKASADYQQKVLVAFEEVENGLSNIQFQKSEIESLQKAHTSSIATREISLERYTKGFTSYLEVTDSERAELESGLDLIRVEGKLFTSTIELIKALGGSFEYSHGNGCD